jgi:hypothetical protein
MSALANPRLDAPIRIEDGTGIEGLGERAAEVLRARGFTNVTVVGHDADPESTSSIATNESDVPTAFLVAGLIGVDLDAVTLRASAAPTRTPPTPGTKGSPRASATMTAKATATPTVKPDPDKNGIVVSLGANARDPADFVGEPFQDDAYPVGKKKGDDVAEPTIEQGG